MKTFLTKLMSSNVSCLLERYRILVELPKYPSVVSYRAIQSFDQPSSRISDGHGIKSNPNTYSCRSHLANEDSIKEALEIISNLLVL